MSPRTRRRLGPQYPRPIWAMRVLRGNRPGVTIGLLEGGVDRRSDVLDLGGGHLGEHREGQLLAGPRGGALEARARLQVRERRLLVHGRRVVDARLDAGRGETGAEGVPV